MCRNMAPILSRYRESRPSGHCQAGALRFGIFVVARDIPLGIAQWETNGSATRHGSEPGQPSVHQDQPQVQ